MKKEIEKKLQEIYLLLTQLDIEHYSLLLDSGGKLLFLYEYGKHTNNKAVISNFEIELIKFTENFSNTPSTTFCSGMAGNIWLLEYFKNENIIDDLLSEIKTELNESFLTWGQNFLKVKNYDFLHGLIGLLHAGNYCEVINQSIIKELADEMLKDLKFESNTNFILDWLPEKEDDPSVEKINFGLAHGLPSAMIVLSNISAIDMKYKKAAIGISNFIFENSRKAEQRSLYSSIIYDRKQNDFESRLAWCYGDLGISLAFWQVGKKLSIEQYKAEAIRIMKHNANRIDLVENSVNDCGLCHGSAGIAHIFRRFWWETNETIFKETADFWTLQTLKMATNTGGLAGYCVHRNIGEQKWINDYGLLEGIAGIGLSLLSSIQDTSTNWDECLMMS
jgi:lantibiotic biosynthesis protein